MRCKRRILSLACMMLAGAPGGALAQQTSRPGPAFAGFTPERCVMASRELDRVARRGIFDSTKYSPAKDTLFATTTDSLELCDAAYGGATTDPLQKLDLALGKLLIRQDSVAIATARKHLATFAKRTPAERAWELYLVVNDNLSANPARLDQARKAAEKLDLIGKPAAIVRVLVHYALMSDAIRREDHARGRAESVAAIAAWKELPEELRLWRASTLAFTYLALAQIEALDKGGDAATAALDTALATLPLEAKQPRAWIDHALKMYAVMGKPAEPLKARFWYNTGVAQEPQLGLDRVSLVAGAAPSSRPTRGKVSLVFDIYRPCINNCFALLAAVRRLRGHFGDQIEVTFLTNTYGYYVDTAPATPESEARYDSTYFVGEVRAPGAIAITETKYSWKADGRRINAPTANELNYPNAGLVLIDRKGVIRYVASGWDGEFEDRYVKFIEGLLGGAERAGQSP